MLRNVITFRWIAPLLLCAGASAQTPLGELFASDPGAPAVAQTAGTGMPVLAGSELSAGIAPATLKIARGGQVRICPQSQLSIDGGEQGLMLGMGAGTVEVNYQVAGSAADVLVTPDFNIKLAGPGSYHFAVGVSARGDTCFKPLPGNASGLVFSELLGSDMYAVAADESALFREGKLSGRTNLTRSCGCPAVAVPGNLAEQPAPPSHPGDGHDTERVVVSNELITTPEAPPPAGQKPVKVDTPFVFSAGSVGLPGTVAKLEFSTLPNAFFAQEDPNPVVLSLKPPEAPAKEAKPEATPAPPKEEKKGFGARIKGFFSSIFHH